MADSNELVDKIRSVVLEIDLLNSVILDANAILELKDGNLINQPIKILPDVMERFRNEIVGDVFHTDTVDELEHVLFYSDDTALIQRRKFKYDFATDQSTSVQYIFNGATTDQIVALRKRVVDLIDASAIVRQEQIRDKITKISEEQLFYDANMNKRLMERTAMLKGSDWRILPDIEDKYEGQKEQWKLWRKTLRSMDAFTKTYDDTLDFFKAIKSIKWPIDPSIYKIAYPDNVDPNGNAIEYNLDPNDPRLWTERDIDASKDYVNDRLTTVIEWRDRSMNSKRVVSDEIQDLMKLMRVEDFVEHGIDYSTFYSEEDLNDMAAE
jgi:hypothetical protein